MSKQVTDLEKYLASVKQRAESATSGPLEVHRFDNEHGGISYQIETETAEHFAWCSDITNMAKCRENAKFIAHARTDVPRLVEMVEWLIEYYGPIDWHTIEKLNKIARDELNKISRGEK